MRIQVFELFADLAAIFPKEVFKKNLQEEFISYLTNTAAEVRKMGHQKSAVLAERFGQEWILEDYLPKVI